MSPTYGRRFDSEGYQFPRTDQASFKRECPVVREEVQTPRFGTAIVEIVPLTGGKPGTFDVCAHWFELKEVAGNFGHTRCSASCLFDGKGVETARAYFRELCHGFREGTIPPWPGDPAWRS